MSQLERDEYFATVWRMCGGSVPAVADLLNITPRKVRSRRRKVEQRLDIRLATADPQGRARYDEAAVLADTGRSVYPLKVVDGVVVVCSDAHIWPGPLTTMQRAFLRFLPMLKPVAVILNGDMFDGAKISRHPSIGWEHKPDVKDELAAVRHYLDRVEQGAPKAKRIWPAGNHDLRFESRMAMVAPEYRGVKGIHLKDHFPNWIPCWRCDINDDVVVRHRESGGEHASYNNVLKGGKTIVTGHDHRTDVIPYRNYTGMRYGVRTGYLCDSPQDPQFVHYLEAKEPNWHPAFAVLTFKSGRLLPPELCMKVGEGEVAWRGGLVKV